jgi:uncharacterized small protein (TIGR04563 family)
MSSPKRKVTLYFNSGMLAETQREAIRQDRSVSWIIQAAWKIAREDVRRLPGVGSLAPNGSESRTTAEAEPLRAAVIPDSVPRRPARD